MSKGLKRLYVYADVVGLTETETAISPPANGTTQITTRVLTADAPTLLKIKPPPSGQCTISIYASVTDQPVSVCSSSPSAPPPQVLSLGLETGNVGASVTVHADSTIVVKSLTVYPTDLHPDFTASLETQLRIVQVLFWRHPPLATAICAYVAALIAKERDFALINAQAAALGRQLAAQTMAGPNASWAPVLKLDEYMTSLERALDSVQVFEEKYEKFQDRQQTVNDQLAAWDVMLTKAINQKDVTVGQRTNAEAKYKFAKETAESCKNLLQGDGDELAEKRKAFQEGVEKWKHEQELHAVFQILGAIFSE